MVTSKYNEKYFTQINLDNTHKYYLFPLKANKMLNRKDENISLYAGSYKIKIT